MNRTSRRFLHCGIQILNEPLEDIRAELASLGSLRYADSEAFRRRTGTGGLASPVFRFRATQ